MLHVQAAQLPPRCNPHLRPYQCQPDSKSALPHVQAASSSSCAVHCRMAVEWTRQRVAERVAEAALGFTEEEQGLLEELLDGMENEDKAFRLEGTSGRVKGKLQGLLRRAGGCMSST